MTGLVFKDGECQLWGAWITDPDECIGAGHAKQLQLSVAFSLTPKSPFLSPHPMSKISKIMFRCELRHKWTRSTILGQDVRVYLLLGLWRKHWMWMNRPMLCIHAHETRHDYYTNSGYGWAYTAVNNILKDPSQSGHIGWCGSWRRTMYSLYTSGGST